MATYSFPYLSPHQSRSHEPTEWEMALAGALENAFTKGARTLPDLIVALNASRVRPLEGGTWTEANYTSLIQHLGA